LEKGRGGPLAAGGKDCFQQKGEQSDPKRNLWGRGGERGLKKGKTTERKVDQYPHGHKKLMEKTYILNHASPLKENSALPWE